MAEFYWCFAHQRVEEGARCKAIDRLGPYESAEAAQAWNQRHEGRQDAWEAEDERWRGTDDGADTDR